MKNLRITGMRVTRSIDLDKVRQVCIDYNYYTCGNAEDYQEMLFKYPKKDMSDTDYFLMAEDIFRHSDVERRCEEYGCTEEEFLQSIISNLINRSWQHVEIITEEDKR